MIRETYSETKDESERFKSFKKTTFMQFLFNVGMCKENKTMEKLSEKENFFAYQKAPFMATNRR